ncbi:MAG: thioredoxin [Coprococcus sp.]
MVKKITNNNMDEAKASKIAVVDFSAKWCGPCNMLAPVLEELAEEMKGKVDFYNADVDSNMKLASEYGIQNIPALVIMKNGDVVSRTVGFQPKNALMNFINEQL